jgi:hypothetical protein
MFGSPGSSSAIDTLFHHIPDIKDQTNVPYANVDPLIQHIHFPDIFMWSCQMMYMPYQKASSILAYFWSNLPNLLLSGALPP